jgi:hypothetical protein
VEETLEEGQGTHSDDDDDDDGDSEMNMKLQPFLSRRINGTNGF